MVVSRLKFRFVGRLVALASIACLALSAAAQGGPNIVYIMADDMGWSDLSGGLTNLGNPSDFYQTPTLDRLASEGMAFTNAYTNGSNCAPTRAAILSGQYANRDTNNVFAVSGLNRGGNNTMLVGPSQGIPNGQDELPGNTFTLAEMLQGADYTTAHFGKFHVGGSQNGVNDPLSQGFDFNFGGGSPGGPGAYHASQSGGNWTFGGSIGPELDPFANPYTQQYIDDNLVAFANGSNVNSLVGQAKHVTDAMTDAAIQYMDNVAADGPFYLQFNQYAVHGPVGNEHARPDLLDKYNNLTPGQEDTNESYGAILEGMDQGVARLINYLENTADPNNAGQMLSDNTIVIFMSDNGGKESQANNGPLRGQKGELWEGGIRVPMIAWSTNADLVSGSTINHTPVIGIDMYQTFAQYAGVDTLGQVLDGRSLVDLYAGDVATLERDAIFWHMPGYLSGSGRDQRPQSVVRSGDHKLVYNYEDASWELYNLANDIGETTNLFATETQTVEELAQLLMQWLVQTEAPQLTFRNQTVYADGQTYAAGALVPLPLLEGLELSLFGDLNGDGHVGDEDLAIIFANWGQSVTRGLASEGDYNSDGVVGLTDLNIVLDNWSSGSPPDVNVPEPTSALGLGGAVLFTLMSRPRH